VQNRWGHQRWTLAIPVNMPSSSFPFGSVMSDRDVKVIELEFTSRSKLNGMVLPPPFWIPKTFPRAILGNTFFSLLFIKGCTHTPAITRSIAHLYKLVVMHVPKHVFI